MSDTVETQDEKKEKSRAKSQAYRDGKKAEGREHRNYMLSEKAIDAIETIAKKADIPLYRAVEMAVIQVANSEYNAGIEVEDIPDLNSANAKVEKLEKRFKKFQRVMCELWYEKDAINQFMEFLGKKKADGEKIRTKKFYENKIENKIIIKDAKGEDSFAFEFYGVYRTLLEAYSPIKPDKPKKGKSSPKK